MMNARRPVMYALETLGPRTAQQIAYYCDLDSQLASVALLHRTRSGLAVRRRMQRSSSCSGPRLLFLYAITERGVDRLDYWESEADLE